MTITSLPQSQLTRRTLPIFTPPTKPQSNLLKTMEINITSLIDADMFQFSHSVAEGGENAGRNTWNAALDGPRPLLSTPEERDAFRDHVRGFGAWDEAEIAAWTDNELDALFLQLIAGDCREAGSDSLAEIDWEEYEANENIRHNFFQSEDVQIYYQLDS